MNLMIRIYPLYYWAMNVKEHDGTGLIIFILLSISMLPFLYILIVESIDEDEKRKRRLERYAKCLKKQKCKKRKTNKHKYKR